MIEHENSRGKFFIKVVDIVIGFAIMLVIAFSVCRSINIRLW